jgi:hypothetical protein
MLSKSPVCMCTPVKYRTRPEGSQKRSFLRESRSRSRRGEATRARDGFPAAAPGSAGESVPWEPRTCCCSRGGVAAYPLDYPVDFWELRSPNYHSDHGGFSPAGHLGSPPWAIGSMSTLREATTKGCGTRRSRLSPNPVLAEPGRA